MTTLGRRKLRPRSGIGRNGERVGDLFGEADGEATNGLVLAPDWRVLVIGLGPGGGLERLAERAQVGEVIGVDPSAAMHRLAERRNRAAIRAGRMTLLVSPIERLPLPDAWIDAASAADALQLCPSIQAAAVELARVLRPGAPFGSVTHEWAPGQRDASPESWLRLAQAAFEDAGFEDVRVGQGRGEGGQAMVLRARRAPGVR